MSVIESNEYREETERLRTDPIILAMLAGVRHLNDEELESWHFVGAASDEYGRRAGSVDDFLSIGGPGRTLALLVKEGRSAA